MAYLSVIHYFIGRNLSECVMAFRSEEGKSRREGGRKGREAGEENDRDIGKREKNGRGR